VASDFSLHQRKVTKRKVPDDLGSLREPALRDSAMPARLQTRYAQTAGA